MQIAINAVLFLTLAFTPIGRAEKNTNAPPQPQYSVEWNVEAGFAPFGFLSDAESVMNEWKPEKKESFASWYMRVATGDGPLARTGRSPFAQFTTDASASPWDEKAGHYKMAYTHPVNIKIRARLKTAGPDRAIDGVCAWMLDGREVEQSSCVNSVEISLPVDGADLMVARGGSPMTPRVRLRPERMIVVAMGDSYDAGEGNPDIPTLWNSMQLAAGDESWLKGDTVDHRFVKETAKWWDTRCDRSFFSHQTFAALKLAAADGHRLVTYLHYSCAGAEVFDGLLVPQYLPPGVPAKCKDHPELADCSAPMSQLEAAVRDLCPDGNLIEKDSPATQAIDALALLASQKRYSYTVVGLHPMDYMDTYARNEKKLSLAQCSSAAKLMPDVVMLGIGGNDAGFGSYIRWALLPSQTRKHGLLPQSLLNGVWQRALHAKKQVLCPKDFVGSSAGCQIFDVDLIPQLKDRYTVLGEALRRLIGPNVPIVADSYPDPIRKVLSGSSLCSDQAGEHHENGWDALRLYVPKAARFHHFGFTGSDKWDLNIVASESEALAFHTVPMLRKAVEEAAEAQGFLVAKAEADAFVGHGWCEFSAIDGDPQYWLQSTPELVQANYPSAACARDPSCWRPYAPMKRFVRTMNDSVRTQSSDQMDRVAGTVHPTAQGQAAIADAMYPLLEKALSSGGAH